ncbi:MAG: DUF1501 domain-containing protein [Pirellulaceae bacterium]|nr:DUF1501 domain-containing protein [Pirellulaceae bacterium]
MRLRSGAEPVLYLKDPTQKPIGDKRKILDVVNALNEQELASSGDPAVEARIAQYEMALRMRTPVLEFADLSDEQNRLINSMERRQGSQEPMRTIA